MKVHLLARRRGQTLPKASSKKKSSSNSRSDDLKELDEKRCERFARLEARARASLLKNTASCG